MARNSSSSKTVGLAAILLALLVMGLIYGPRPPSYMPEKLWGVWKTDHERYVGRYIDISGALFCVGQGGERIQVGFVERVEMASEAGGERYSLYFRPHSEDQAPLDELVFYLREEGGRSRIQLKSQPSVGWYREAGQEPAILPAGSLGP
jgi:hypothetical protein